MIQTILIDRWKEDPMEYGQQCYYSDLIFGINSNLRCINVYIHYIKAS